MLGGPAYRQLIRRGSNRPWRDAHRRCPPVATPIADERRIAAPQRDEAEREERIRQAEAARVPRRKGASTPAVGATDARRAQSAAQAPVPPEEAESPGDIGAAESPAPWGTAQAKQQALDRLRRQITENRVRGERDESE